MNEEYIIYTILKEYDHKSYPAWKRSHIIYEEEIYLPVGRFVKREDTLHMHASIIGIKRILSYKKHVFFPLSWMKENEEQFFKDKKEDINKILKNVNLFPERYKKTIAIETNRYMLEGEKDV
ncbi:MAG: hypothetical protein KAI20_01355 [Thermoplasmatales archaeon]|nr:hypothetical protein [Thermoplasmatales archaeon]